MVERGTFIEFPFRFAPFKEKVNILRKIINMLNKDFIRIIKEDVHKLD